MFLNYDKEHAHGKYHDHFISDPIKKAIVQSIRDNSFTDSEFRWQLSKAISFLDTNINAFDGSFKDLIYFQVAEMKPITYDLTREYIYSGSIVQDFDMPDEFYEIELEMFYHDSIAAEYKEKFGIEPLDEYMLNSFLTCLYDSAFIRQYINYFIEYNLSLTREYEPKIYRIVYFYLANWYRSLIVHESKLGTIFSFNRDWRHYMDSCLKDSNLLVKHSEKFLDFNSFQFHRIQFERYPVYYSNFLRQLYKSIRQDDFFFNTPNNKLLKYELFRFFLGYRYNNFHGIKSGIQITNENIKDFNFKSHKNSFTARIGNIDYYFCLLYDLSGIPKSYLIDSGNSIKGSRPNDIRGKVEKKNVYHQSINIFPFIILYLIFILTLLTWRPRLLKIVLGMCIVALPMIILLLLKPTLYYSNIGIFDKSLFNLLLISDMVYLNFLDSIGILKKLNIIFFIVMFFVSLIWIYFEKIHFYVATTTIVLLYLSLFVYPNRYQLDYYDYTQFIGNLVLVLPFVFIPGRKELQVRKGKELLIQKATQTAAVAVSARNLSHITGSHVLPNMNKKLREWADKLNDFTKNSKYGSEFPEGLIDEFSYMEQVNRHIMERMEFIAELSTSTPAFKTNIPFSDVTNYLFNNPDAFKYNPGWFIKEGILNSDELDFELNGISKESLWASPGDMMGKQAFCLIIEGFIRNILKHEMPDKTIVTMNVSEDSADGLWCIDLFSENITKVEDKDKFLKVIREKIKFTFNEQTFEIPPEGWGLKEMLLACAYLRGQQINEGDIDYLLPNFYDNKGQKGAGEEHIFFGYRFYVQKPKYCVISGYGNSTHLSKYGILFSDTEDKHSEYSYCIKKSKVGNTVAGINEENQKYLIVKNEDAAFINNAYSINSINSFRQSEFYKSVQDLWLKNARKSESVPLYASLPEFVSSDQITKKVSDSSSDNIAFFDNHGVFIKKLNGIDKIENSEKLFEDISKGMGVKEEAEKKHNVNYYESYGSGSMTGTLIEQEDFNSLKEAAVTRVFIIDERIQEYVLQGNDNNTKLKLSVIFDAMSVIVPNMDFDLVKVQPKLWKDFEKQYEFNHFHYLVVHITIIEKMLSSTSNEAIEGFMKKFNETYSSTKIVFTSGRGLPYNLPVKSFFIQYTTLQNYCMYSRSKVGLVRSLQSIRKR